MPAIELIDEFGKRLELLMETLSMQNKEFAESIGIAGTQLSRVKQGKVRLTYDQIMKLCYIHKVRAGWLLDGEEPMFKHEKQPSKLPDVNLLLQLRNQLDAVLESYEELDLLPYPDQEGTETKTRNVIARDDADFDK